MLSSVNTRLVTSGWLRELRRSLGSLARTHRSYTSPDTYQPRRVWYRDHSGLSGVGPLKRLTDKNGHGDVTVNRWFSMEADTVQIDVSDDRRNITVKDQHGYEERYNATWLRHHCQCRSCWEPDSLQYTTNPSSIPPTLSIKDITIKDKHLCVSWNEDPHAGSIPLGYLAENAYSQEARQKLITGKIPTATKGHLPKLTYDNIMSSEEGLWNWVNCLNDEGLCLVERIPERVVINDVFTVEATETPINLAYTSMEIQAHMDLTYYESPPGYQFLKVERFDDCIDGGESILTDAWYEAERMRELHPEEFDTLTRVPVTFFRKHSARQNPAHLQARRPHFTLESGQIISLSWASNNQALLGVAEEYIEPYYRAIHTYANMLGKSESKVEHRLRKGEMICFNNRRFLHARSAFSLNGGARILKGCYLNTDEFKSTAEVLSRIYNDGKPAKRVFNNCIL